MRCPYEKVYYRRTVGNPWDEVGPERFKYALPGEKITHISKKDEVSRREACPGTLQVSVVAIDEPDYHSDHYAVLEVNWSCTEKHEVMLFSKEAMSPAVRKGRALVPFDKYNLNKWLQVRVDELGACEVG